MQPGTTWSHDENRGFTSNEPDGLKPTSAVLAADLEGFLQCLGGYLPFDYVPEKLLAESTNIQSAWDMIYEIYDVEINTTHFLDYASMQKDPPETYRVFFDSLVGFVRQHLPRQKLEAKGVRVRCDFAGETLTIGLTGLIKAWSKLLKRSMPMS